jgi:hypothetical protein
MGVLVVHYIKSIVEEDTSKRNADTNDKKRIIFWAAEIGHKLSSRSVVVDDRELFYY